jgi:HEAT repeat protein
MALDDADAEVRARAALVAGRGRQPGIEARLCTLVADSETRVRAAAAEALGHLGAPLSARGAQALERALTDVESEVRGAALVALGRLPRERALGAQVAIAARLDDDTASVRQRAAEVLGQLGDRRAVFALIARLGDPAREVRQEVVDALAQLGDERAATAIGRLVRDPSEDVQVHAIEALGALGSRAAVPALIELVERGTVAQRGRAAVALGRVARGAPKDDDPLVAQAVTTLVTALGRDDARAAAREALIVAGPRATAALLRRAATTSGDELATIVDLLRELGDTRATPLLMAELERARVPSGLVVEALAAMMRAGDRRPLPSLLALLGEGESMARRRAMAALQGTADARAVAALGEAVGDPDREVRLGALAELARLASPEALPALERALDARDEETAAAAARALAAVAPRATGGAAAELARRLIAALERGEAKVRRDAADAIGRLTPPPVGEIAGLLRRARSGPSDRRADLILAVGAISRGRADAPTREALGELIDGRDLLVAIAAVDALGAQGDPASAGRLVRAIERAADPLLRRRAVAALARIPSVDTSKLVERLEGDADPWVRAEAAWALGLRDPREAAQAVPALERALGSPSTAVQANALASLARLGRGTAGLDRFLLSRDPAVRANAAVALAPVDAARSSLERLRRDEHPLVRAAVERALARRARPAPGSRWLAVHLVDFDGGALADAPVLVALPDGLVKATRADSRGAVREERLPDGACLVSLVE